MKYQSFYINMFLVLLLLFLCIFDSCFIEAMLTIARNLLVCSNGSYSTFDLMSLNVPVPGAKEITFLVSLL